MHVKIKATLTDDHKSWSKPDQKVYCIRNVKLTDKNKVLIFNEYFVVLDQLYE